MPHRQESNGAPPTANQTSVTPLFVGRLWFGASVIVFLLMSTHMSDVPQVLGRYTIRYAALLGAMGISTVFSGVAFGLVWFDKLPTWQRKVPPQIGPLIIIGCCVAIALVLVFLPVSAQPGPMLFQLYVVAVIFGVMIWLLYVTNVAGRVLPTWTMWVILAGIVGVVAAQIMQYLGVLPGLQYVDEAWLLNRAYSYVNYGLHNSSSMYPFKYEPLNTNLASALQGLWLNEVGMNLANGRFFLLLLGYLTVGIASLTAWRLYGVGAALAGASVGLFVPLLQNYVRPDVMVPLATSIGIYYYFAARRAGKPFARLWRDVLVGLALGLTVEGHVYGASYTIGFGLIYLVLVVRDLRAGAGLRAFLPLAGYTLGGLLYGLFFIFFRIPDDVASLPELVTALTNRYTGENDMGGGHNLLGKYTVLVPIYYSEYVIRSGVEFAILLFGLGAGLWRLWSRQSLQVAADRTVIGLWILSTVVFTGFMAHSNPYYWIYNLPFLVILSGASLAQLGGTVGNGLVSCGMLAGTVALATAFIAYVPQQAETVSGQSVHRFVDVGDEIAAMLPPDIIITGWETLYLAMPENRNFINIGTYAVDPVTDATPLQAVIFTRNLDDHLNTVWEYVDRAGLQLAQCFETPHFGKLVALYVEPSLLPEGAPINCADWERPLLQ